MVLPSPCVFPLIDIASALVEQSRAGDSIPTDFPWLAEVHSKIWNREDLRPQLFRKVEVTRAHYDQLQKRLNELHTDRDSQDYNSTNPDVLRAKLDLLQSPTPVEALSPEHPADDNDDLEGSSSLFPSILSFVDLSTLGLEQDVPTRVPLLFLLRQEYEVISNLIEKRPKNSGGSVIVSGQPGTGKTIYLYLRLIENMIEGRPFLFQDIEGNVYHVAEKGVEVVKSRPSKESIMAFVDLDEKKRPDHWIKQASPTRPPTQLVVALWSYEELILTGIFLFQDDLTFKLLRESTSYFGYNPRRCFAASHSAATLEDHVKMASYSINSAAYHESDNLLQLLREAKEGGLGADVSHTLFQILPANHKRMFSECLVETVSRWALDLLLEKCESRKLMQVLHYLKGTGTPTQQFSIRRLTDSNQPPLTPVMWTYPEDIQHFSFQNSTVLDAITKAVNRRGALLLIPLARNFPAVDSILYGPNDAYAVTCIQITMNNNHPILVSGLQQIQSWLKLGHRPKPWRFLFVVPSEMASAFASQALHGDTTTKEWAEKVHQYVLGLEEKTIFKRQSPNVQHTITSQQEEEEVRY
ncbi:hypothetical protein BC827DRAFT_1252018 [Russula dissimulans]|nr:hypothetical protein BC827DRAFT_1252018 [Russula dissimulans]